jgi:exopolysaccharide production protein ExoQ
MMAQALQGIAFRDIARPVLPATAFILPPLAVLAPLGTAPLLAIAATAALILGARRLVPQFAPLAILIGLLAVLGLWATASGLWSIIPGHSVFEGLRFLALSACGLILLADGMSAGLIERRWIARALIAGTLIALALLAIERFAGEPIVHWWHGTPADQLEPLARYDRGVTVLVLLMAPVAVCAADQRFRAAIVAAIVAAAVLMSSAAALFAATAGLAVFAVGRFAPRPVAGAMIAGVIALGIAIPAATPSYSTVVTLHEHAPWIKWSGIHRLLIWRFGADRVAERPILGWGMDVSRAMPGGKTNLNDLLPDLHYPSNAEALPLHPHDAALEWQLELGIPGLALGLAIVVGAIYRIGWRVPLSPYARAAALGLGASALVIGLLSFGIWQAWWLSSLWLTASLHAASGRSDVA